uniref:Uncharacterized protein n=1 Tax=Picea sitchensis TaxID=3332 RepID=A9NLU9_PICSI|nr:unknown [Picea sitchensis]
MRLMCLVPLVRARVTDTSGLRNFSLASKNYLISPLRQRRGGPGMKFTSELMPAIMAIGMMRMVSWRKLSGQQRRRCGPEH